MKSLMLKVLVCLGLCLPAHAEVYKWVDEQGKVHFGDKPPPKTEAEALDLPVVSPSSETRVISDREREVRTRKLVKALEEERLAKEKAKEEKKKKAAKHKVKCTKLSSRIKESERVTHYYRYNESGEREYMDNKAADELRKKLKEIYKLNCISSDLI